MSGITFDQTCIQKYEDLKLRRSKASYLIFRIKDEKIVLEEEGDETKSYDDFKSSLTSRPEGAYAVYDFKTQSVSQQPVEKLVFYNWAPDILPPRQKMIYGATMQSFKSNLTGIKATIQGSDAADIDFDKVAEVVRKA